MNFITHQTGVGNYMSKLSTNASLSRTIGHLSAYAPDGPEFIPQGGLTYRNDYGWIVNKLYNQGKYYHYSTTRDQGASMFWKITTN